MGIIVHDKLSFDEHVTSTLKACSQRSYIMKWETGAWHRISLIMFSEVSCSPNVIRLTCLRCLCQCLTEEPNKCSFRRFFNCWSRLWDLGCLLHDVDSQMFKSMQNSQHSIKCLLWDNRNTAYFTRTNHPDMNPHYHYSWSQCSMWTDPVTILYDVWFLFLFFILHWYITNVLTTYARVGTYTFCCV